MTIILAIVGEYLLPTNADSVLRMQTNFGIERIPTTKTWYWFPKFVAAGYKLMITGDTDNLNL